jgi:hypothetical protein
MKRMAQLGANVNAYRAVIRPLSHIQHRLTFASCVVVARAIRELDSAEIARAWVGVILGSRSDARRDVATGKDFPELR